MHEFTYLEWIDASGGEDWQASPSPHTASPCHCTSVGIVLLETDTAITITPTITNDEDPNKVSQVNGWMTIPKQAILMRRSLEIRNDA
jgi:hypothetical protein